MAQHLLVVLSFPQSEKYVSRLRRVLPADYTWQLAGGLEGGYHAGHQAQAGGYPGTNSS